MSHSEPLDEAYPPDLDCPDPAGAGPLLGDRETMWDEYTANQDEIMIEAMKDFRQFLGEGSYNFPPQLLAVMPVLKDHMDCMKADKVGRQLSLEHYKSAFKRLTVAMENLAALISKSPAGEMCDMLDTAAQLLLHIHTNHGYYINNDGTKVVELTTGIDNFSKL